MGLWYDQDGIIRGSSMDLDRIENMGSSNIFNDLDVTLF